MKFKDKTSDSRDLPLVTSSTGRRRSCAKPLSCTAKSNLKRAIRRKARRRLDLEAKATAIQDWIVAIEDGPIAQPMIGYFLETRAMALTKAGHFAAFVGGSVYVG